MEGLSRGVVSWTLSSGWSCSVRFWESAKALCPSAPLGGHDVRKIPVSSEFSLLRSTWSRAPRPSVETARQNFSDSLGLLPALLACAAT